ncbi:MAG: hypothetical protein B5M52_05820 [Helicobacteraceae bacterium 4484_230]|nr:MAG: hypothetical protein B5M52_05820 [Helicobacteraceae bacterium 4484_230]
MKNFKNLVAHDYFGVDAEEVWSIVKEKLLPLRKEIVKLL